MSPYYIPLSISRALFASSFAVSCFSASAIFSFAFCVCSDCHWIRCFSLSVFISSWYLILSSSSCLRSVMRILNNRSICSSVIDGSISNQYCFSLLSIDSLPSTSSTSSGYLASISSRMVKVKSLRVTWDIVYKIRNIERLYKSFVITQIKFICFSHQFLIFSLILLLSKKLCKNSFFYFWLFLPEASLLFINRRLSELRVLLVKLQ